MILAGDIGGTKTNLAVFDLNGNLSEPLYEKSIRSQDYPSFSDLLRDYFKDKKLDIKQASFGVAGPVINGRCATSNISWIVDEREVMQDFGISKVKVLNDLEAMGYGTLMLQDADLKVINPGKAVPQGNIAIIAAGTGLGEAFLVWENGRYRVIASEGGHADFGPQNELDLDLLKYLLGEFEHVSYERIISGIGLINIYQFLKSHRNYQEPPELIINLQQSDPNVVITQCALAGTNPICVETLKVFVRIYGAEAGNLALKVMSTGGVFIGGGIAPKILPALEKDDFMEAFTNKGRLSSVVNAMPVKIILNEKTALLGAAYYARNYF